MHTISVLIKPASSSCNLKCRYCFYEDESHNRSVSSYSIMSEEMIITLAQRIDEALDHAGTANISFQGGEPTLAGLSFFQRFTEIFHRYPKIDVHYSIQTNGTLINDEFAAFLVKNHFLVGVSLDGYQSNMDKFRFDKEKQSVYFQVLRRIECLKNAHAEFNILTVITRDLAKHPKALCRFYLDHHFEYVQLIPCLANIDEKEDSFSLTPELYSSFYRDFYAEWEKAFMQGRILSVNMFENLAGMLKGVPPYQCGMLGSCTIQYVIEANGNVYPCDFYCLDDYCLGNIQEASFTQLTDVPVAKSFLAHSACMKKPCTDCSVKQFCHGGCRRQNSCWLNDDHCAYQEVLLDILPRLQVLMRP